MEGFIEVTTTESFEPGTMRAVELDGHKLLVSRVGDDYFVTDARCPHIGGPLAEGELNGTVVTCPSHHSQFDVTDGSCLRWTDWKGPVLTIAELVQHPRPLRAYESTVEDGKVLVGPQKPQGAVPE
ncbi:MAG: Rieske 2Fe-2S domain-containing protein [Actinomycetia bacterium]|nr:Rieske 2Fe-2S domain-containing protein [Actinomycetes bacterium]